MPNLHSWGFPRCTANFLYICTGELLYFSRCVTKDMPKFQLSLTLNTSMDKTGSPLLWIAAFRPPLASLLRLALCLQPLDLSTHKTPHTGSRPLMVEKLSLKTPSLSLVLHQDPIDNSVNLLVYAGNSDCGECWRYARDHADFRQDGRSYRL